MTMEITQEIIDFFRVVMPAYSDIVKWPDNIVKQALCEADAETGGKGWGQYDEDCHNFKQRGLFYYAAHWLAVTYLKGTAEDESDISPTARLNVAAKSVGDESLTFRVGGIQETADDWLSLTNYGVQYLRLRSRSAMGARAV